MATIRVRLHWDPKAEKVVKTYEVLSIGPRDKFQFTTDSDRFIIKTTNKALAKKLGLQKVTDELAEELGLQKVTKKNDLYQVKKAAASVPASPDIEGLPDWLGLKCGTIDKQQGRYEKWGGVGPEELAAAKRREAALHGGKGR
jgi:hypothetical protein